MFTKKVKETFDYPDFNGRIELEISIKKLTKYESDEIQKDVIRSLNKLKKQDRNMLLTAIQEGNLNEALGKIEDTESLMPLLGAGEAKIKKCIVSAKVRLIQDDTLIEEESVLEEVFKKLTDRELKWISDQVIKYNPELGETADTEKKS